MEGDGGKGAREEYPAEWMNNWLINRRMVRLNSCMDTCMMRIYVVEYVEGWMHICIYEYVNMCIDMYTVC